MPIMCHMLFLLRVPINRHRSRQLIIGLSIVTIIQPPQGGIGYLREPPYPNLSATRPLRPLSPLLLPTTSLACWPIHLSFIHALIHNSRCGFWLYYRGIPRQGCRWTLNDVHSCCVHQMTIPPSCRLIWSELETCLTMTGKSRRLDWP